MAALYAEAGVSEYWIVLPRERRVEVYRGPEGGRHRERRVHGPSEELLCQSVAGLRVRLAELFPEAPK
jgi:Uma2 family endonuclease